MLIGQSCVIIGCPLHVLTWLKLGFDGLGSLEGFVEAVSRPLGVCTSKVTKGEAMGRKAKGFMSRQPRAVIST